MVYFEYDMAVPVPSVPVIPAATVAPLWGSPEGFLSSLIGPTQFSIDTPILLVLFLLACIGFAGMSIILTYHWRKFQFDAPVLQRAERLYYIGSGLLLGIALVSIIFTL